MATLIKFDIDQVVAAPCRVDDNKWTNVVADPLMNAISHDPDVFKFFGDEWYQGSANGLTFQLRDLIENPQSQIYASSVSSISVEYDIYTTDPAPVLRLSACWDDSSSPDENSATIYGAVLGGAAPRSTRGWESSLEYFTKSIRRATGDQHAMGQLDQSTTIDLGYYGQVENGYFQAMGPVAQLLPDRWIQRIQGAGFAPTSPSAVAPLWNVTQGSVVSVGGGGSGSADGITASIGFTFKKSQSSVFRSGPIRSTQISNPELFGTVLLKAWSDRSDDNRFWQVFDPRRDVIVYKTWESQLTFFSYADTIASGVTAGLTLGPSQKIEGGSFSIGYAKSNYGGNDVVIPNTANPGDVVIYDPTSAYSTIGFRALTINKNVNLTPKI